MIRERPRKHGQIYGYGLIRGGSVAPGAAAYPRAPEATDCLRYPGVVLVRREAIQ